MRSSPQLHDLCLLSPAISAYSAVPYVPVSRLRSNWQPLDQHLISHGMIIYSAARSSPQPLDLCLLSPAINVYSAVRYVPDIRSLGWEDPWEEGMATHSSILAWRIPGTAEPGGLPSMGSHSARSFPVTGPQPLSSLRRAGNRASTLDQCLSAA